VPGSRARTPARSERAAALLIALAVALFGACRAAGNPTPPPARTVDGFFSAWSSLQASEMAAHFGNERRGSGRFLQRWLERTLARGAITGFSVRRTDAISTDDRGSELAARAP
jgi:hypothetical protein